ncbi:XapX domain-containing protein [Tepidibacter aestuarii]|uniref:XapX domain-containing protein n=1 Tax=Tepidibacter aestuarii TaxID=2925782 RepID=UPI0020BE6851|nr:DUF1427 family protein [Tepidibacter aestuarii]CAH2213679.1 XapX domain-containing protein [Tepidibacter aestuarii]
MNDIKVVLLSLLTGMITGIIFTILKFPLPAPPTIQAFMGIFGVWFGAFIIRKFEGCK